MGNIANQDQSQQVRQAQGGDPRHAQQAGQDGQGQHEQGHAALAPNKYAMPLPEHHTLNITP